MTDGQLPLRQSLHPEACTKDIKLPAYYWRFCDLRKEFARFKSGDASQGSDGKTSAATTQLPSSINEMYTGERRAWDGFPEVNPVTNPLTPIWDAA